MDGLFLGLFLGIFTCIGFDMVDMFVLLFRTLCIRISIEVAMGTLLIVSLIIMSNYSFRITSQLMNTLDLDAS